MVTAFELPSEEDMAAGSGNFLQAPGMYHLQVVSVNESPVNRSTNAAIDGFEVELVALEGDNAKKTIDVLFHAPKMSSKDGGKWAKNKQAAFLIATGLVDETKLGKSVQVDLQDAVNRQCVAEFELGKANDKGKQYLQLAWANIYHIDDPRGANCPKNVAALGIIPKTQRRDPASFAKKGEAPKAAPTSTGGVSDDLGDL